MALPPLVSALLAESERNVCFRMIFKTVRFVPAIAPDAYTVRVGSLTCCSNDTAKALVRGSQNVVQTMTQVKLISYPSWPEFTVSWVKDLSVLARIWSDNIALSTFPQLQNHRVAPRGTAKQKTRLKRTGLRAGLTI